VALAGTTPPALTRKENLVVLTLFNTLTRRKQPFEPMTPGVVTEAAARDTGLAVSTGSAPVSASSRGFIHEPGNTGLIKLVVDTDRDLLVGATTAGPAGGEVLGMLALAVHARVPVAALAR
jgi:hypothetical protein